MADLDVIARILDRLDARLRTIEQQGVASLEKHDATNHRLDQLNGSTARNTADIAMLQQQMARAEGQLAGRDHGEAKMSANDRRLIMLVAALGGVAAPLVAIVIALWGNGGR